MKKILKFITDTEGQALVESALVIWLILIPLILGIIEFGWILNGQITVTNAAREGARAVVVCGISVPMTIADAELKATPVATTAVTKCTVVNPSLNVTTPVTVKIDDTTDIITGKTTRSATVDVTAKIKPITRFFNGILDLDEDGNVILTSKSVMRVE